MNEVASDFLTRCFAPGSTVALLLRAEHPAKTQQRVIRLEQAVAPRYLGWLAYQNQERANVYVAANPLLPGSRRRTKESVGTVRHLYLDIDDDGDARLAALRASDAMPTPSAILSTSPRKYQVLWKVEGFDFTTQEEALKRLARLFGGDPACTDCNRVLRIPDYLNWKYSPAHRVTVEYPSDRVSGPSNFCLPEAAHQGTLPMGGNGRKGLEKKDSQSEFDWAWACAELARGIDANKLTRQLAAQRSDKPNPVYYAQRTVDMAFARQRLLHGTSIDDVITMLEDRRSPEISEALCSARAREIATTAQRMIARQKTA